MPISQLPCRLLDAFDPMRSVDQPRRDPIAIAVVVLVCAGVVDRVGVFGFSNHRRCLFVEPCLATVGVDRGIRSDLRAVDRDRAEPGQPGPAGHHQHLAEQIGERVLVLPSEPRDRGVIRNVLRAQNTKRDVGVTQPLDLTRRSHAMAVGVDHQPQQHPRVITSSTRAASTPPSLELADVQDVDSVEDKPGQMISRQPLPHIHR
jgi:hypothetical protein